MLLLTAALALSGSPQQAKAQTTPQTLVSNIGQVVDGFGFDSTDLAQAFTTGDDGLGYTLTSVAIYFAEIENNQFHSMSTVTIRSDSGGSPGTVLATLTDPPSRTFTAESLTFTAPGQGLDLDPNTQYWLVVDITGNIPGNNRFGATTSDAEDAGAASGWSIHNVAHHRTWNSNGGWGTFQNARLIAINGVPKTTPPECATANADGAYIVPADWQLTPAGINPGDRFRLMFISSTQRDATSANIADYNTNVQTAAKNGHSAMTDGCGNQFKVVGSTTAVNARDKAGLTGTGVPIYWLGGVKSADDYADFFGSSISGRTKHEDGSDNNVAAIFATGSNDDGTAYSGEELGTTGADIRLGSFTDGLASATRGGKAGSYYFLALSPVFEVDADITFKETEVSISENAGEAPLTVVLGEARSAATTVNIILADDMATAGADFEYAPNQYRVTIPAGDTEATVDIGLIDDSAFEPDEVFTASIQVLGGLDLSVGGDATITILDDDLLIQDPPILRVTEGQSAAYTLRLAQRPTSAVTVALVASTVVGTTPVTLSRSSLTMTNSNWNVPTQHRVTVTAPEDANAMDERVTIIHSMTSSDSTFNSKTDDYQVRVGDRQSGKPLITLSHHEESPRSVKGSPRSIEEDSYFLLEVKMSEGYPQQPMVVTFTVTQPGDAEYRPPGAHNRGEEWVTFWPQHYPSSTNTREVLIWTEDDNTDEPTGELTVTVNTGDAYNVGTTDSLSIEVRDNDIGPHDNGAPCMHCVYITSDSNVTEGSAANVTVRANPAPERDMDVDVWVLDAPQRGDFLNRSDEGRRTVTIPARLDIRFIHPADARHGGPRTI